LHLFDVADRDIDDVLQDVLLAAYRGLDRYDGTRYTRAPEEGDSEAAAAMAELRRRQGWNPLCAWLFGIAWRQVSHYRDRAHRRREVPVGLYISQPFARVDEGPSPEQRAITIESIGLMGELLSGLDFQRRGILVLHDLLELGIADIAQELGINPNTAQNRLRLAREDFRAAVRRMRAEKRRALREGDVPPEAGPRPEAPPPKPRRRRRR
jgi:RNA polymerase sigma-70 factor (ECF subfamily)